MLANAQQIRWHEAEPGRILQVRCFLDKQQVDIVGVYQFAFLQKAGMSDTILDQRRRLLAKLDKLLASLPVRSQLILGGDLNVTLTPTSRVAGYGLLQRELSEKEKADQDLVIRLLQRHKLSALNTWSKKGTAATYLHAKGRSQIDYVCARQAVSDGEAKTTKPVVTEMAGWRTTGHHPLVGSIPHRWTPWANQHREGRTEPKAGPDLTRLGSWTTETHPCGVRELREAVLRAGGETPERLVRPELAPVTDEIKGCWKLRRRLQIVQTLLGAGMVFVFKYFRLRLDYMRAHRLLKQTLRARKRSRTLALLQQAEAAASRHDMRGLFGVINMLCPRKGVQRIRLRDDEGNLMNGLEECKVLAAYARELFMAANSPRLPLLRIPAEILDIQRWHLAASKLKAEKAAPNATPPLRNWKQHSTRIVPILHAQAVHHLCRDTPQIPGEWTEVQLAWLAKPGKCPSKPSNLRTVGLMAGDTKMFMTVLKEAVQAEITKGLWDIPQFAYRKLASTTDALLRGSLHCIQVRALAGQVNTDVTARLLTGALPELQGGLMLSLDLAKAFDCMPFGVMYESLREVGVSDALSRLIVETHRQSVCIVRHCGHSEKVQMKRGLRQGCPLAPSVFTAWTIKLCRLLGTEWCRTHTSLFADDVHGHWIIRTCQEFHEARARALKLIAALHRSGMKVNFDKSMAVLLLRGSAASGIKKRFVKWDRNRYVLVLGTDDCTGREVRLPVHDRMEYLGATLSYGAMEMQTVQSRAAKAWANYTKLRPLLRTASSFSTKQRLRVFRACIVPALLHGIIGVGITAASLRLIQSIFSRMLRKILRVHEHGIANHEVLRRADLAPADLLHQLLQGKIHTLQIEGHQSSELSAPALHRASSIAQQLARVDALPASGVVEVDRTEEAVTCPVCGVEFHNQKSLEAHYTAKHEFVHQQARTSFDRRLHTLFGLPQCRLCRQTMYDWVSMERHITEGRCPRLKQAAAEGKTVEHVMQQVLQDEQKAPPQPPTGSRTLEATPGDIPPQLLTCTLAQLSAQAKDIAEYQTRCILCAQIVKVTGHMKIHWQSTHKEAWAYAHQDAISGARSLRAVFCRPCQFCGSNAKNGNTDATHHATKCSPLFQVLAVRKLYSDGTLALHLHSRRGPALKQHEKEKQYVKVERTGIKAMLCGQASKSETDEVTTNQQATPQNSDQSSELLVNAAQGDAPGSSSYICPDRSSGSTTTGTRSVRLHNPHNLCYMNAGILALVHALQDTALPRGLRQIQDAIDGPQGSGLNLAAHFGLRSLFRGWTLDNRQKDAAEFTGFLLIKVGFGHMSWESRVMGRGVHQVMDAGTGMLYLDLPHGDCDLQELVSAWSYQAHMHAIVIATDCFIVQLGRFPHRGKSMIQVRFAQEVNVPVFTTGIDCEWRPYFVVAGLLHFGDSPNSGHYRAVLREQDDWWLTDDGVPAVPCAVDSSLRRAIYTVWLKRKPPPGASSSN